MALFDNSRWMGASATASRHRRRHTLTVTPTLTVVLILTAAMVMVMAVALTLALMVCAMTTWSADAETLNSLVDAIKVSNEEDVRVCGCHYFRLSTGECGLKVDGPTTVVVH